MFAATAQTRGGGGCAKGMRCGVRPFEILAPAAGATGHEPTAPALTACATPAAVNSGDVHETHWPRQLHVCVEPSESACPAFRDSSNPGGIEAVPESCSRWVAAGADSLANEW